jgi:hypothetical protein
MAVVLKTTEPETVPGVRIPLPPPDFVCRTLHRWRLEWSSGITRLAGLAAFGTNLLSPPISSFVPSSELWVCCSMRA